MASSTPPHYSITAPKHYQNSHPAPHNQPRQHGGNHKGSYRLLHSSSASGACSSSSSAVACSGTAIVSNASAATASSTSPAPSFHRNAILEGKNPLFLPCYSQTEAAGLTPEFRRARTTRVVSKRNLSSPRTSYRGGPRNASPAAAACLSRILRSGPDDRAVLAAMTSYQPDLVIPEDYCHILHELGDRGKCPQKIMKFFFSAMPLMRSLTDQGRLLTSVIGTLGRIGRPELARQVFDDGVAAGYANTVFAYSALISAYARTGHAAKAIDILESMKAKGIKPTTISYNAVIDACGKGGLDLHITVGFFREMLRDGFCPDRKTFNSLLAACSRAGHLEDARMVFDEMIHLDIGQDIYTYNTFIDAICKCGNMKLAVQVMQDMCISNVQPNVVTYSTLMDGYSKLEQFDEALNLYEKMKVLRMPLDRVCYNTLLSIFVKTGRYEEIARVCQEMETMGVDKDTVTYNSLISGFGKQGKFEVVSYLIQEMKERGVAPSVLTYSTLIDIYSKAGMYGDAANAFLDFKESGLKADVVLYSSFIDILAKNGLVDCAVWLLDEMTRMSIEPNVVTYNTIIDAFGKSRISVEGDVAGNEFEGAGGSGGHMVSVFSQLARGLGRPVIEEARRRSEELFSVLGLFQKMVHQGVKPNVVTFSAILNACSRCNSFKDASLLLEQLKLFDNVVYGVAHGLLMGHRGVWPLAHFLFDQLRQMDTSTSSAFYNALTDMLWHFGQRRGAQQVVLEGVRRHVWENTWSEFNLDLHLMSVGAAQAMVHAWLLTVRSIVFEGRELPQFLSILTGWGKHSKVVGASTLRLVIDALLNSIRAPFHLERFNVGRFVSPGAMVAAWLRDPGTINILLLHDQRVELADATILIPRLQAVQL